MPSLDAIVKPKSLCVALDVAGPVADALQTQMQHAVVNLAVEWNAPDTFHVTLAYAPDVDDDTAARIIAAVDAIPVPLMNIQPAHADVFHNESTGGQYALHYRVLDNDALRAYQAAIYEAVASSGVEMSPFSDPSAWIPHITMGYASDAPPDTMPAGQGEITTKAVFIWHGDDVVVYDSEEQTMTDAAKDIPPIGSAAHLALTDTLNAEAYARAELQRSADRLDTALMTGAMTGSDGEPVAINDDDRAAIQAALDTLRAMIDELATTDAAPQPGIAYRVGIDTGQEEDYTVVSVMRADTPVQVEGEDDEEKRVPLLRRVVQRMLAAVKARAGIESEAARTKAVEHVIEHGGFKALENGLFVAAFSNNFVDRDGEIISAKAFDDMIDRMRAGIVPYPELWFRHKAYTAHGQAFFVARAGNIVYAVGKFHDTPIGKMFEKFYKQTSGEWAMSHGFKYDDGDFDPLERVYHAINTFEISVLKPESAANQITPFNTLETIDMSMSEQDKKALLDEGLSPSIVDALAKTHKRFEAQSTAIKERLNLAFKDKARAPRRRKESAEELVEDVETFAEILDETMSAQADTMELVAELFDELVAQQDELAEIRDALAIDPAPASEAVETELTEEAGKRRSLFNRAKQEIGSKSAAAAEHSGALASLFKK